MEMEMEMETEMKMFTLHSHSQWCYVPRIAVPGLKVAYSVGT